MSDFTKGPWTFSRRGQRVYGGITNGRNIAQINVIPEFEANGRLIAAAPELLEALVEMDRVYETGDFHTEFRPALERARAAIAKARGEQS